MELSSFKEAIQMQFNGLMMKTIKGTLKQKRKQLSRYSKHEVLFCELGKLLLNEHATTTDNYASYLTEFQILCFSILVHNEKISTVLKELSERQRSFILLYYFYDMSDREIATLYHISRSAVGYTRNKGLERLKVLLNEELSE